MLDIRSIQLELARNGFEPGPVDGMFGPRSIAARDEALREFGLNIAKWSDDRKMIAIEQWTMLRNGIAVVVDGLEGPGTLHALELWQNRARDVEAPHPLIAHQSQAWPRQPALADFYGRPGENHTRLKLPYPFRLAWDVGTVVKEITINERCAESAGRALAAALDHYGADRIKELGLDLFGGCYANRNMRGGKRLSVHAFAAAIDIDPMHNQLRWGRDRARMAGPEYAAFLDAFEAEGWVSLGRERNFDFMHVQAARL